MRRLRWVIAAAVGIVMLGAVVLVGARLALGSEAFARWLLAEIAERSNGRLQAESVSGALNDDLRIGRLFVDFGSGTASASAVRLTLDWRSLIARSIVLERLEVDRIDVAIRRSEAPGRQTAAADFSMLVLIRAISVGEIEVEAGEQRQLLSALEGQLRLLRNHLELSSISVEIDATTLSGDMAFTFAEDLSIDATVCADGNLAAERVLGCAELDGTPQSLQVDARVQRPFPATAIGTVRLSGDVFVDLALSWQDATLTRLPEAASERGTAQVTGTLERLRVAAEGRAAFRAQAAEFEGQAVVGADAIEIERLRLEQAPATAEISGTAVRDFSAASLAVSVRNVDPQQWVDPQHWLAQWPADLDVTASIDVATQPALSVAGRDIVVTGELRGYPLAADGAVQYVASGVTIENLRVVSRTDQLQIAGRIADALAVDVVASIADLGVALPEAGGSLTAELEIGGTIDDPSFSGTVELAQFAYAALSAGDVRITGAAGLAPEDPIELAISAAAVDVSGTAVRTSVISVSGTAAAHRLEGRATADDWELSLAGDGAIDDRNWQARLDRFEFAPGDFGVWQLTAPADVSYGTGAYSVSDLCLSYTLSRVCASVAVAGSSEDMLRIDATNFDVGILAPFIPPDIRARGLVDVRGELSNFIADPRGQVTLSAADAQVDIALAAGVFLPVPIARLNFGALLDDAGANISLSLDAAEAGNGTAALAVIGNPGAPDSRLEGSARLQWHDAAALALLSPDVEDVEGSFAAAVTIGGTVDAPVFGGGASWADGALTIPAWALVVDGIAASIDTTSGNQAAFGARGNVDGTPVTIDGSVELDPQNGWPMQLRLRGENVSLVQLAGIEITVSPELEADVRLPRVEVTGRVLVPSAHISEVTLPQQAVVPSADAVVHGRTLEVQARPIDLIAALSLELGDDVTYTDPNLDATVTGRLDLDYRSGAGAAAEGELTVLGEYNAYGTPLALERGQLVFVGPLDNPSLDIRAVRTLSEVTVGAQLTGTLQQPVTTLFSDPAMSEAETLSWLLFGQPLDVARESESRALRNAALSMGLQQALPVIERIGDTLGFDDFSIRTSETDVSALMAGKYLSPNLYFRYSYGLFNRIGGILLRYRINDRFSLETRSGEHNSMDLLYTVEKN